MNRLLWGMVMSVLTCICPVEKVGAQTQGDTLKGVEVKSSVFSSDPKASFQPGAKVLGIDSALRQQYQQQSVATLLSQVSSVFIKSYGFNSLATLNFRGASSAQSAVYWEGIPLMNGATGISDISLLPVAFSDSISVQYGGSGALGGSGNVGGALLLQSKQPSFSARPHLRGSLQAGVGSFHQFPACGELGYTSGHLALRLRGVWVQATNDFPAIDEYGNTFVTENAALRGEGILLEAVFKADSRNTISLHGWQQAYHRQIPRALFESSSAKEQKDNALRFLLDWKHSGHRTQMYSKVAFLQDGFDYSDLSILLATQATTRLYFGEWGIQGRWSSSTSWLIFAPVQYMELEGTAGKANQSRVAVAGNLKKAFFQNRFTIAANGRAELIDGKLIGLPGIGGNYQLSPSVVLRASVQRSYRMPTLNELYYEPGGNKDLKPETGWSTEVGATYAKKFSPRLSMTNSLTAYNRQVKDWIIWLGGAIWTPHNLAAVHSRGLETENELLGKAGSVNWLVAVSAAYTRATPTESYLTNDNSIGRQIPYTPMFTGAARTSVSIKGLTFTYVQNYVGTRYITADESASLEPYSTGNLLFGYTASYTKPRIGVNASINNIWNSQYAVVAYRPMPGINYLISISLGFD